MLVCKKKINFLYIHHITYDLTELILLVFKKSFLPQEHHLLKTFTYLEGGGTEMEIDRKSSPSSGSCEMARAGQAEARSWELHLPLPPMWRGSKEGAVPAASQEPGINNRDLNSGIVIQDVGILTALGHTCLLSVLMYSLRSCRIFHMQEQVIRE